MQREVTRLLEELAPERTNPKAQAGDGSIQQYRSPNGCILQADDAALSVTFYGEAADQDRVGELQIVLWKGVVSRRGARPPERPAQVIRQEVVNPIETPVDESTWRSRDGKLYSTTALIAHCRQLLDAQIGN